ncbi:MAG: hypothetical protein AAGC67_09870 [Myxococcota bacterium]
MAPENSDDAGSSMRWLPLAAGGALAVGGFLVGQWSAAVDSIPHDVAAEDITAEQMEAALNQVIRVPLAFERSREMIRLLERLTPENIEGALQVVADNRERWDPVDLQLLTSAWTAMDPIAAANETRTWTPEVRREVAFRMVIREWAAGERQLEAVDYVQSISDDRLFALAGGPLIRGWALSGEADYALEMARRLWDSRSRLDVVDGYCRGVLQTEGPDRLLALVREVDPALADPFDQRLVRVGLIVAAPLRPAEAAALASELLSEAGEREGIFEPVFSRVAASWQETGFAAPADWLATLPAVRGRNAALVGLLRDWRAQAPTEMAAWFEASALDASLKEDLRRALAARKRARGEAS